MKIRQLLSILGVILSLCILAGCSTLPENTAVSKDGVQIRFDVHGQGKPAVIFVHGFAGDTKGWNNQINHFSMKYRVVTMGLPGFGESGNNRRNWSMGAFGEDVVSIIEHLKLDKVVLVGHSMGAAVILEAAKRIPEQIIGLVPCDVFHNVESKLTGEFIERARNYYGESLNNIGWEESARAFVQWRNNDLMNALEEIHTPIICINSDRFTNEIEIARNYTPLFDIRIIEGVGHGVMTEAPEAFNRHLEEIIEKFVSNVGAL